MKIIYNKIIPFNGFRAVNIFGVLFVKKGSKITEIMIRHEIIHTVQMKEMLYILFYAWYIVEWIVRLFEDRKTAYNKISFEKEAYSNELHIHYLENRKRYAWVRYLKK
ncbi:MAG: hypothetical protein RRY39_08170 [Odoribacter sp.]